MNASRSYYIAPDLVELAVKSLRDTGIQLTTDWQSTSKVIFTEQQAINPHGRLEAVFLTGYTPPAHAARESADRIPGQYAELAAIGEKAMEGYTTIDQNNASRLPR